MIRKASAGDAAACAAIYNYYVENGTQTFETEAFTPERYAERIQNVLRKGYPFLVAEDEGIITGFAYLDSFSPRYAYRYTCDLSIYIGYESRQNGTGRKLFEAIEAEARAMKLRVIVSIITAENTASLSFHEKMGFRRDGYLPEVGNKFDRWLGVYYMSKDLWQQT